MDEDQLLLLALATGQSDADFVGYLQETLIPDLKESGRDCTAEDFETAIKIIARLTPKAIESAIQ